MLCSDITMGKISCDLCHGGQNLPPLVRVENLGATLVVLVAPVSYCEYISAVEKHNQATCQKTLD
jgi:hypothetical protein